jgi:hypothetical protein
MITGAPIGAGKLQAMNQTREHIPVGSRINKAINVQGGRYDTALP